MSRLSIIHEQYPSASRKRGPISAAILEGGRQLLRVRREVRCRDSMVLKDVRMNWLVRPIDICLGIILLCEQAPHHHFSCFLTVDGIDADAGVTFEIVQDWLRTNLIFA